ncbi:MAG: hypothetical protein Q8T04_10225 [Bacteroidota bacterium]|nr:hypothetical protein [Bacteroidota bacterium]
MRTILFIFVSFIAFSCKTNYYLSEPLNGYPNIDLQTNLLVASNFNLKTDTAYFEDCLEGLILNVEAKSDVRIIDEIFFVKRPNTAILMDLKVKYNVDGLLLLTKLRVQKRSYDVASNTFKYIDNNLPAPFTVIHKLNIPWTNLYVRIISEWEYHDFTTGKSFKFSVANDKVYEFEKYVADIDIFLEEHNKLFAPILYQNGKIAAYSLIGLEY